MKPLTEANTTITFENPVDLLTSGVTMDTKSVQVLAMSYMMYKIGKYKYFSSCGNYHINNRLKNYLCESISRS